MSIAAALQERPSVGKPTSTGSKRECTDSLCLPKVRDAFADALLLSCHCSVQSHPTVLKTTSDREHYVPIYQRYLKDEAQSEAAKATRAGKVIP